MSPITNYTLQNKRFLISLIAVFTLAVNAQAQSAPFGGVKIDYQEESDPFQGDWKGEWSNGRSVYAMVSSHGNGRYQIRVLDSLEKRTAPYDIVKAQLKGDELHILDAVWSGVFKNEEFEGIGRFRNEQTQALSLKRFMRRSPTEGKTAPPGATRLFDGSDFKAWRASGKTERPINWKILDSGAMEIGIAETGNHGLETKKTFDNFELHLEFRLPLQPLSSGQARGNSGLYMNGYEVQILDSYSLEGYNNECGAFYKFKAPTVNMCYPPLQWQTYDISYRAARFDTQGEVLDWPTFTVKHNGVAIHKELEIDLVQHDKEGNRLKPPKEPGRLFLQAHGSRVQYRNIWILEK